MIIGILEKVGIYAVPLIIAAAAVIMLLGKTDYGSEFLSGAREGLETSVRLLPSLVMLICAVRMVAASGALDLLSGFLKEPAARLGFPEELVSVILIRPFSGSAATAVADNLYKTVGPDSFAGRCASVLMGSSDTIIYTLALYFSSVGIKKTRYALPASFIVLLFCSVMSVIITRLFFG